MNTNEVLANRAGEILGEPKGTYTRVHPNDHVNMGQSTNDVFPTATRLSILLVLPDLLASAVALADALDAKATEFARVLKTGRTHLQDAVPITLGQEFGGYAANVRHAAEELESRLVVPARAEPRRHRGRHRPQRRRRLHARERSPTWSRATGLPMKPARNRFRVTQSMGDVLDLLGRAAPARRGSRQGRLGPAAPEQRSARRPRRDAAARGAARLVDHARQGQPVGARDGQPGLPAGVGLRRDDPRRVRRRASSS